MDQAEDGGRGVYAISVAAELVAHSTAQPSGPRTKKNLQEH